MPSSGIGEPPILASHAPETESSGLFLCPPDYAVARCEFTGSTPPSLDWAAAFRRGFRSRTPGGGTDNTPNLDRYAGTDVHPDGDDNLHDERSASHHSYHADIDPTGWGTGTSTRGRDSQS